METCILHEPLERSLQKQTEKLEAMHVLLVDMAVSKKDREGIHETLALMRGEINSLRQEVALGSEKRDFAFAKIDNKQDIMEGRVENIEGEVMEIKINLKPLVIAEQQKAGAKKMMVLLFTLATALAGLLAWAIDHFGGYFSATAR